MSFEFVLSYIDIEDDSPIELIENHFLRKANTDEMVHINRELSLLKGSFYHAEDYTTIYEQEIVGNETECDFEQQTEKKWKYYIIDYSLFKRKNQEIDYLKKALMLLKKSIYLGFSIYHHNNDKTFFIGHSHTWKMLYTELEDRIYPSEPQKYSKDDFNEVLNIHTQIHKVENNFLFIEKALDDFYRIQCLGKLTLNEHLKILGYFSIIEMLIAHKPKLKESIDSISHQISTKYNLLFKKFKREIDFGDYFSNNATKSETIWKKLYAYRSDLAHGNITDFSKEYKILDKYNGKGNSIDENPSICINNFLEEVIKNTLLLSIENPEFIYDLKQC